MIFEVVKEAPTGLTGPDNNYLCGETYQLFQELVELEGRFCARLHALGMDSEDFLDRFPRHLDRRVYDANNGYATIPVILAMVNSGHQNIDHFLFVYTNGFAIFSETSMTKLNGRLRSLRDKLTLDFGDFVLKAGTLQMSL